MFGGAADAQRLAPGTPQAITDPRATDPSVANTRLALLRQGEADLLRGDAAAAEDAFDRAALMLHAPDTEMGLVRTYMQAGQYRRALAFCAHTAGGHVESASASGLYAWLLRVGGQDAFAERVLRETLARSPGNPILLDVQQAFAAPWPLATGALLEAPHRMAPQAWPQGDQPLPPPSARGVSGAVLIGDGRRALAPAAGIAGARRLWVRDGLGRTTEATIDVAPEPLRAFGVAMLRLAAPLGPGDAPLASRDLFAGSPGYVVEFALAQDAAPAWPWLRQGFFGGFVGSSGLRKLGIDVPPGPHGGPVFDATGRLAGIVVGGEDGQVSMVPASMFRLVVQEAPHAATTPASAASGEAPRRMPADEAYERALKVALQVMVE